MSLLRVENLNIWAGEKPLVREVSFSLEAGETLALVGASGAGKSLTMLSLTGLLPAGLRCEASSILVDGVEVTTASGAALRRLRGGEVGMIFQDPLASLNPLQRTGVQIGEALALHGKVSRAENQRRVLECFETAGLEAQHAARYPHQLSGGQRQRVMIAMALANAPKLIIADEPEAALDGVTSARIMRVLAEAQKSRGLGMLLISHDAALIRRHADRILYMRDGWIVEKPDALPELFHVPGKIVQAREVLKLRNVSVKFPVAHGPLRRNSGEILALSNISFTINAGETLAVTGESGSGKSSLALAISQLVKYSGEIVLDGQNLAKLRPGQRRLLRRDFQIVFQDPFSSLSPRLSVGEIIAEGLDVHEAKLAPAARDARIFLALEEVGLPVAAAQRYPHAFSGGERQRIAIARALILKPKLLVLDEPASALDDAAQMALVNLLRQLQARHGMAYVIVSHDLRLVQSIAHSVLVLRAGEIVEYGEAASIFEKPEMEYTRNLLEASDIK